jgi:hypothetical protein
LYDAGQPDLFWIIGNIRSKAIYDPTKVAIWALDDFRLGHPSLKRVKDVS